MDHPELARFMDEPVADPPQPKRERRKFRRYPGRSAALSDGRQSFRSLTRLSSVLSHCLHAGEQRPSGPVELS